MAGTVDTLAGLCGEPGFADGSAEQARFSAAVWDVYCAPHDCSVLVADPANGALRRITRDPESCPKPPGAAHRKGAESLSPDERHGLIDDQSSALALSPACLRRRLAEVSTYARKRPYVA